MNQNKQKRIKVFGLSEKNKKKKKEPSIIVFEQSNHSFTKQEIVPDQMLIQSNDYFDAQGISSKKQVQEIFMQDNQLQKYLGLLSESEIYNDQHDIGNIDEYSQSKQLNVKKQQMFGDYSSTSKNRKLQEQIDNQIFSNKMVDANNIFPTQTKQDLKEIIFQLQSKIKKDHQSNIIQNHPNLNISNNKQGQSQNNDIKKIDLFNLKSNHHQSAKQLITTSIQTQFLQKNEQEKIQSKGNNFNFNSYESPAKQSEKQTIIAKYLVTKKKVLNNVQKLKQSQQKSKQKEKTLKSYLAIQENYVKEIQTMINKYQKVAELKVKNKDINKEINKLTHKKTQSQSLNKDYYFDFTSDAVACFDQEKIDVKRNIHASDSNWRKSRTSIKMQDQLNKDYLHIQNLRQKFKNIGDNYHNQKQKQTLKYQIQDIQSCLHSNLSRFPKNRQNPHFPNKKHSQQESIFQTITLKQQDNQESIKYKKLVYDQNINQQVSKNSSKRQKSNKYSHVKKDNFKNHQESGHDYFCSCDHNNLSKEINILKNKMMELESKRDERQRQKLIITPITLQSNQLNSLTKYHSENNLKSKTKIVCTKGTQQTIRKIQSKNKKDKKQYQQQNQLIQTQNTANDYKDNLILSKYLSQPKIKKSALKMQSFLKKPQKPTININLNQLKLNFPLIQKFPKENSSQYELICFGQYMYQVFCRHLAQYFDKRFKVPKGNYKIKKYADCIHYTISNTLNFDLIYYYKGKLYFGQVLSFKQQYLKHGIGFYWNRKKYKYVGQFYQDKKHGIGTINCINGDCYSGNWHNGKKQGKGLLIDSLGDLYEGIFMNGKKQGNGIQQLSNGDFYQGQFSEGKLSGMGMYWWNNGSFYKGTFKNGSLDGKGIWISKQNDYYDGQYKQNKKHGVGTYRWSNGVIFSGKFIQDIHCSSPWNSMDEKISKINMMIKGE